MLDDERFAVDPDVDLITPAIPSLDDDRILALELVRATEAGAIAAARFLGRGDDDEVDGAATDAMRPVLGTIPMRGVVADSRGLTRCDRHRGGPGRRRAGWGIDLPQT